MTHCWYLCYIGYPGPFFVSFGIYLVEAQEPANMGGGGGCDLFGMSNNAEIIRSRKEIESKLNDSVF